jgi:hypothetical protein
MKGGFVFISNNFDKVAECRRSNLHKASEGRTKTQKVACNHGNFQVENRPNNLAQYEVRKCASSWHYDISFSNKLLCQTSPTCSKVWRNSPDRFEDAVADRSEALQLLEERLPVRVRVAGHVPTVDKAGFCWFDLPIVINRIGRCERLQVCHAV